MGQTCSEGGAGETPVTENALKWSLMGANNYFIPGVMIFTLSTTGQKLS